MHCRHHTAHIPAQVVTRWQITTNFQNVERWTLQITRGLRQLTRYSDSLLAGRSGDRIPCGGEIFRTGPIQPQVQWVPDLFPWGKAAGSRSWKPTPSNAEVKERVELYIYFPLGLYGLSWGAGGILPFISEFSSCLSALLRLKCHIQSRNCSNNTYR